MSSFFGKIMGGQSSQKQQVEPEENQPSWMDEEELEAEELISEDEISEDDITSVAIFEDTTPQAKIQVTEEFSKKPESQNTHTQEDWGSDYDGQLNIDMYQTKDNVIIRSLIAGVKPDDLDVTVANDMVTIKGERKQDDYVESEDYLYQECYWGHFSRSVIVPVDIDSEEIDADLKDGVLTIIIPKAAKAKTKKVRIKSA